MSKAPDEHEPVIVSIAGQSKPLSGAGNLRLENGEELKVANALPPDLPPGYHELRYEEDQAGRAISVRVIVSPGQCWLPEDLKAWGWSVQLYSLRSQQSWGIGDFGDLHDFASWAANEQGASMLLLNPLSAASPLPKQEASPYFPSSRVFLNPIWLSVVEVPGLSEVEPDPVLERLVEESRRLNSEPIINRNRIFQLKMEALEHLWKSFFGSEDFDRFCEQRSPALQTFATFCALAESHGGGWHTWPEEYRHPGSDAVRIFAEDNRDRVCFHQWIQWQLDRQLGRTAGVVALMQDLPIGVDPDGADAWAWQDVFASGVGVGAPPDEFNTQGQNWGLPPFDPQRLREAGYEPLIQTIRAAFRHCGGLRIDHVMGLFRLFWVPQGMSASEGAYVRYPADELLAILALESHRAKAYVVGEDLGTVEDHARAKLADANVLSYRVLWFEKQPPAEYPENALAAVTTHDLPTIAGLWSGADLQRQHELGLNPNHESTGEIYTRVSNLVNADEGTSIEEVIGRIYEQLATAPCRLLVACIDDALMVEERPNIPATTPEQTPNWSRALPKSLEEIKQLPLARRIARALKERRTVKR